MDTVEHLKKDDLQTKGSSFSTVEYKICIKKCNKNQKQSPGGLL